MLVGGGSAGFHFQRMNPLYEFTGTFDDFFELFLADQTAYGSYWENLRSWWALRRQPNILVLSYEQMHADLDGVVRSVAAFVGKELTQDQVAAIGAHCSLDSMRSNPMYGNVDLSDFGTNSAHAFFSALPCTLAALTRRAACSS